ncbi:MAG: AAA family ATPase, partial [Candidatus Nanoarchaeia archaeon]|nr:AAA family ATPase [Candidatus Nanoarchaeia archaeon]
MAQRIKEIGIKGFKSFNKKTVIKFPNKLCCVVGANGSGKSNILDALCFVLGKMSKKDLRAEKLDHLIFNGGKTGKPSNFAEVSMTLDNNDKLFPVEDKEIIISRTIFPQGGSEFRINDKKTTRAQILDILRHAGIDPDGYNIILQDEIKRFVEMSGVERRQVIEELSGISVYEEKKEKSIKNLEEVERKIRETNLVLNEREKNLKELERQKKQAELYLQYQEDKKYSEACLYAKKISIKKSQIDDLNRSIEDAFSKIKEIDLKIEEKNNELNENKKMIQKIKEIERTKPDMKLMSEVDVLKEKKTSVETSILNHNRELRRLAERKEQISGDIEKTKVSITRESEKKDKMEKELAQLKKELAEKEEFLTTATHGSSMLYAVETNLVKYNEMMKSIERRTELKKEYSELASKLEKREKEYKEIIKKINETADNFSRVKRDLGDLNENLITKREELARVKSNYNSSLENINTGVKEILKAKIKGVYDTVGALGSVKKEFSLPLRVAAGSRIENIVVDDEDVAKKCVNYLRSEKKGIATFLPLNKISSIEILDSDTKNLKADGVKGFAISFVNYPKKLEKVFKYVFGSTLVVENLESAKKLGINTARMVTMEGDLVEKSGAITGGYTLSQTAGFRIEGIDNKITDYEKEIE